MEDGNTESENVSRVIQDFVFLCRKIDSINGYFCRYIINSGTRLIPDGFCFLDPLEELSLLGNMLFRSTSV